LDKSYEAGVSEKKASRWLKLFHEFIKDIRIISKEVSSQDKRGSPLVLWESQKRFLNEVGGGLDQGIRKFNCLKSRQLGATTVSLAIDVFWLAVHDSLTGCLVCDTPANSLANRRIIRHYVDNFPEGYFGSDFSIVGDNRDYLEFSNGSRLDLLVAGAKKKGITWAQGRAYSFAHMTEVAFYGDDDGLKSLEESFAQGNPDRLFMYESTANGYNHWERRWKNGKDALDERSFFIGWWASEINTIPRSDPLFPQYAYPASGEERQLASAVAAQYGYKVTPEQIAWIRHKEAKAGQQLELLTQNNPWTEQQAFVQTGYSFFQTRQINKDIKRLMEGGEEYGYDAYRYDNGTSFFEMRLERITDQDLADIVELKVWEEPNPNGKYVIGFDPAYGRNEHKDKHCIEVYRCFADKIIQVAEYATADVDLRMATWAMAHMAGSYRDCIVNVELSGPGRMVMQELDHVRSILNAEMNAKYVQTHPEWTDALANARWYMYTRPDNPGKGYAYNFESTWRSKQELMHGMRSAYIMKEVEVKSLPLLNEMNIVVINGNEIGAPESRSETCKDDRVFATALAVRAWANWVRPEMLAQGFTYERTMQEEAGAATALGRSVNSIVYRFMKTQAELAQEEPDNRPRWKVSQGLE
jgi:hypothetical protein